MGRESNIRSWVVKALSGHHAVAVENSCSPGTPDVYSTLGWIEIKQVKAWPKKSTSVVRVPHFSTAQRAWLIREHMAGRPCWLLLRAGSEYRLFPGQVAAAAIGQSTQDELRICSVRVTAATLSSEMGSI